MTEQGALGTNPQAHDFDWSGALHDCSIACQFVRMEHDARLAAARLEKKLVDSLFKVCFDTDEKDSEFFVSKTDKRFPKSGSNSVFQRKKDHILILLDGKEKYRVTLTLNEEGKCRYQIDGEGEYFRWQVLRKALIGLFKS